MGNELSTLGGAVVTTGSAIAAGATFGQVQSLNDAMTDSAKYTAEHAEKTVVRHVGETFAMAVATVGTSVASGVTFGQIDALNDAVIHCAKRTSLASQRSGEELLNAVDGLSDGIPIVGHVKGGICYAVGERERGDRAMKSSSRSVSVLGGGVKGYLVGGPIGAVAGGIIAGAAMDGTITGIESAVHKEFRPHGQIACWDQVANAKSNDERIGGIVGGVMTPVADGLSGYAAGKTVHMLRHHQKPSMVKLKNHDKLMGIPGAKALKQAMSNWKLQAPSDSIMKQATDGLGGIFAGGKTMEALQDFANSDKAKEKLQEIWEQVSARVKDAFDDKSKSAGEKSAGEGLFAGRLTGDSALKGKEIVIALFVVYIAISAVMLTSKK